MSTRVEKALTAVILAAGFVSVPATAHAGAQTGAQTAAQAGHRVYDVKRFGAIGDGTTYDDDAIDRAIAAASDAGGGTVVLPPGRYRSRTLHLRSHVTLQLDQGATLLAAASEMDPAEPNPDYDKYQDYGHSHFQNALLWGDRITDFAVTGRGVIEGDRNLETSNNPPAGTADKALSLTRCSRVRLSGVTFKHGGHFAVLMNGCRDVRIDGVTTIADEDDVRDGINLINTRDVHVTRSHIEASDDALVFKSDFALGATQTTENVRVEDSSILSTENNALQFGSETCGDFRHLRFNNLRVLGAGKAGIGLVSMDGATIEDVRYSGISMTKTASPIYMKIGERRRCPGSPGAGRIRDIRISGVTGTALTSPVTGAPEFSSTLAGLPGAPIEDVRIDDVRLTVPGGHPASDAGKVPPEFPTTYPPRDYGTRPAYGWWLRHVRGITFGPGTELGFAANDDRPAFLADDSAGVRLHRVRAARGNGSPFDVVFTQSTGWSVSKSTDTTGAPLRVSAGGTE